MDSPIDSRAIVLGLVPQGARVLELGCSAGLMTAVMHERGHQVVGVEYDPQAAAHAAPYTERIIVGDLEAEEVYRELDQSGSFEVVMAADVLEHLRNPARCLRRALDYLAPGGRVILSIPNVAHGDVRLSLLQGNFDYADSGLLDRTHIQLFTRRSLSRLIQSVGLEAVEWHRCVRALGQTEVPVDPALVEFGRRVLASDPEAQTYQWIVVCRSRTGNALDQHALDQHALDEHALDQHLVVHDVYSLVAFADAPPPPPASRVDDARRVAAAIKRRVRLIGRRSTGG
jgi:SAM-dependent methyltransferase